jgi:hypothetical protein
MNSQEKDYASRKSIAKKWNIGWVGLPKHEGIPTQPRMLIPIIGGLKTVENIFGDLNKQMMEQKYTFDLG